MGMSKNLKIDVVIFILFLIPIATIVLNSPVIIGDEIINFQSVMKFAQGFEIYKDFNVLITPMFFYIGKIFLMLLGKNILAFRIYNIIIFGLLIFGLYKLFETCKINKFRSFIYTCLMFVFIMPYINVGANYNVFAIFLYVLGIIMFIKKREWKYSEIIQGVLIYLMIFTKQNIGLLYVLSIITVYFINYKSKAVLKLIKIGIVSFALCGLNILYMLLKGNLYEFIDYVFLGMNSFTKDNFILDEMGKIQIIIEIVLAIFVYVGTGLLSQLFERSELQMSYAELYTKDEQVKKGIVPFGYLIVFSLFLNLTMFPILNLYHVSLAIILNVFIIICELEVMFWGQNESVGRDNRFTLYACCTIYFYKYIWNNLCC